jgi:hypothetical protein
MNWTFYHFPLGKIWLESKQAYQYFLKFYRSHCPRRNLKEETLKLMTNTMQHKFQLKMQRPDRDRDTT